jgi:deoxyribose-phosphate aldolase
MDPNVDAGKQQETPPGPLTYEDLASRLETAVWSPTATDEQVVRACTTGLSLGLAAVFVRPDDLDLAVAQLRGTSTAAGSIAGYPYGWSTTPVKLYEARDMLRRGAREIAVAAPIGKLISRQFQAVETELLQMAKSCREEGARLRLVLDAVVLPEDLKVIAMKIAKRCEADFVMMALDPTEDLWGEIPLYRRVLKWFCGLAAPIPGDSLASALRLYGEDAQRMLCESPGPLLAEWKSVLDERAKTSPT